MDQQPSDPLKQLVPLKQLLGILVLVVYMIAALAVIKLHSSVLGLVMLAPLIIFMVVYLYRLPREQAARIAAQIKKHEESPFGRLMRFVQIVLWVVLAAALFAWLYERLQ